MQYYDRLRELRKDKNLTQKQVAIDNDVAQITISQYETNKRKPTPEMLMRLAKYYNVSVSYLLGLTDDPTIEKEQKK